jgi:hypothetical protein
MNLRQLQAEQKIQSKSGRQLRMNLMSKLAMQGVWAPQI